MSKIACGELAPTFVAQVVSPAGAEETLHFEGAWEKPVVLYFYPKDSTPGCTKQACDLRDGWGEISQKAYVYGISPDSSGSHGKFIKKQGLPFPLIVDADHQIAETYGVWVEKNLYGKKYMGVERTTFIIGKDGRIQKIFPKVKADKHFENLMAELETA